VFPRLLSRGRARAGNRRKGREGREGKGNCPPNRFFQKSAPMSSEFRQLWQLLNPSLKWIALTNRYTCSCYLRLLYDGSPLTRLSLCVCKDDNECDLVSSCLRGTCVNTYGGYYCLNDAVVGLFRSQHLNSCYI